MPKRRLEVAVDTWGTDPQFARGTTIEVDTDDTEHPFPYDIDYAVRNGSVRDLDAEQAARDDEEQQQRRARRVGDDIARGARLPSGDGTIIWGDTGVSRHERLTAEQQQAAQDQHALGAGIVTDREDAPDPSEDAGAAGPPDPGSEPPAAPTPTPAAGRRASAS